VSEEVFEVLKPWMERGWVSVQDLKELEVYEGRSHHQFTMLNDCMLRAQRMSNWTFFFDVDEYLFVPGGRSLREVLVESEGKRRTQIRMKTVKMSDALCSVDPDVDDTTRDANNARCVCLSITSTLEFHRAAAVLYAKKAEMINLVNLIVPF